jgi:hypothetical protein
VCLVECAAVSPRLRGRQPSCVVWRGTCGVHPRLLLSALILVCRLLQMSPSSNITLPDMLDSRAVSLSPNNSNRLQKSAGRKRAAFACKPCNVRRLKCDAVESGWPCSRCRSLGRQSDCELHQSRRGKYAFRRRCWALMAGIPGRIQSRRSLLPVLRQLVRPLANNSRS